MSFCLKSGNKIIAFGKGTSAAIAQQFATELAAQYRHPGGTNPVLALETDSSPVSSDMDLPAYEPTFANQVAALSQVGDIALGICSSGRSPGVIAGLQAARQRGTHTVALVGAEVNPISVVADEIISIPSSDPARIYEAQAVLLHILRGIIEKYMQSPEASNQAG